MKSERKNTHSQQKIEHISHKRIHPYELKQNQHRLTTENISQHSFNNDNSNSKFDHSNTLANLLMFQSATDEQDCPPLKNSKKCFTGLEKMLEEEEEEVNQNDLYPPNYRDNMQKQQDEDCSEQSEDLHYHLIQKLFGILGYKVRILQRASFQSMFIEASRKAMFSKYGNFNENESSKIQQKQKYFKREEQIMKMMSFSKSQSLEMMPIREESESQMTKRQSGITFNNLKNNEDFSRNSSEFHSKPQSQVTSSFPESKIINKDNLSSTPFSFNNSIKRKHIASFSHPSTSLGKKVQIDSIQKVESIHRKIEPRIQKQDDSDWQEQKIRLEDDLIEYFQRTASQKIQQKSNRKISNLETQPLPSQIHDINENDFFEGMEALIDLSLYSRIISQDQSSNEECIKISDQHGVMVHYSTDQNTEDETKDRSIPLQNRKSCERKNKFSPIPFCQKAVTGIHIQNDKQNAQFHSQQQIQNPISSNHQQIRHKFVHDPQQSKSPKLTNKLPTKFYSYVNTRYPEQRPNTNYHPVDKTEHSKILKKQNEKKLQQVNEEYGGPSLKKQANKQSQIKYVGPSQIRRPLSQIQIRSVSRGCFPVTFHYPMKSQHIRNQINFRYISPNTSRPKSEQPQMRNRSSFKEHLQETAKNNQQDKIHLVRSQYFKNKPINADIANQSSVQRIPTSPNHISAPNNSSNRVAHINKAHSSNNLFSPKITFTHYQSQKEDISALQSLKPSSSLTRINSDGPSIQFIKNPDSVIKDLFGELGREEDKKQKEEKVDKKKSKKKLQLVSSKQSIKVIKDSKRKIK